MATGKPVISKIHIEHGPTIIEVEGERLSLHDALNAFHSVAGVPMAPTAREDGTVASSVDFGFSSNPLSDTEWRITDGL